MMDRSDDSAVVPSTVHPLSGAQRAFIDAAEVLGATTPAAARPISELPRLSGRELDELVELGLVREAADWRYYVFRSRRAVAATLPSSPSSPTSLDVRWTPGRILRTALFWLILILIPILLVRLTTPR